MESQSNLNNITYFISFAKGRQNKIKSTTCPIQIHFANTSNIAIEYCLQN